MRHWRVWAAKFWHFLNPSAFVIRDQFVDAFFKNPKSGDPVGEYLTLVTRFREFALAHNDWIPSLKQADEGHAVYDTKLWDKVFYQVGADRSAPCH